MFIINEFLQALLQVLQRLAQRKTRRTPHAARRSFRVRNPWRKTFNYSKYKLAPFIGIGEGLDNSSSKLTDLLAASSYARGSNGPGS
jgi:hypothetical protein